MRGRCHVEAGLPDVGDVVLDAPALADLPVLLVEARATEVGRVGRAPSFAARTHAVGEAAIEVDLTLPFLGLFALLFALLHLKLRNNNIVLNEQT